VQLANYLDNSSGAWTKGGGREVKNLYACRSAAPFVAAPETAP